LLKYDLGEDRKSYQIKVYR